jgi:hypothetical protein
MRKLIPLIAAVALFAVAAPVANAAKGVPYKGKTTGGHTVTFNLKKNKMHNFATGVPMQCISIQGGGAPISGAEVYQWGWVKVPLTNYKTSEKSKPSLYYGEVDKNHTITTRKARSGKITGSVRLQYSFLIPKYPIGTFSIYSCLGEMKFSAKPAR